VVKKIPIPQTFLQRRAKFSEGLGKTKTYEPMKPKIIQKTFLSLTAGFAALLATTTAHAQGLPGTYELSFCHDSILYVGQELICHASVADSSGNAATAGAVVFQMCSSGGRGFSGGQPSAACDIDGTARWMRLSSKLNLNVSGGHCLGCLPNSTGDVCVDFGANVYPRTIGFRFKYLSQRSGIADGISDAEDVTWLPLP
jgi:hypothetical protein